MEQTNRRRWPRITIVLPPEDADRLAELARGNYRTGRAEALRLLLDGIARERVELKAAETHR